MENTLRRFVLLLTATIDPGDTPMVVRRDPLVRLRDYEKALSAWLDSGAVRRIVLFENSGYDLSSLREIALRYPGYQVEFLSFPRDPGGAARGKGYAEMTGIARTLRESQLIGEGDLVVKCTGRLTVVNSRRLLESIHETEFDVMCMLHSYLTYADSRIFVATPAFITEYLLAQQAIINDFEEMMFENALACATAAAVADRRRWRPFPLFPVIEGVSGTSAGSLTEHAGRRLVRAVSHRVRRFVYEH